MELKCLIVEDQLPAQRILTKFIQEMDGIVLVDTLSDPIKAIDVLNQKRIDILFLDIHLPQMSGMDLLSQIEHKPHVILTTAFENYAIQAFEYNVVDYLLKPFSYNRFKLSVNKVIDLEKLKNQPTITHTFIKSGNEHVKINFDDIIYCKAYGDYSSIYLQNNRVITNYPLKYWDEQAEYPYFIRIHKSYLVNLNYIKHFNSTTVYLKNESELPLGRKYKENFIKKMT